MLTIENLRTWGANIDEGLQRCLNNEAFYLKMVGKLKGDTRLAQLREAIEAGDLKTGFEHAHALKGVLANLALTPVLDPVLEMTELLRAGTQTDYTALLSKAEAEMSTLQAMLD
ncbi:MAG: Hpt domain-containing protein [Clostridia bacterium]|nr:Hpt domain-containing protein [Clostridia bacterium]